MCRCAGPRSDRCWCRGRSHEQACPGFGGFSSRVHARCRSVGVLERGRRWSNTEFPRSPAQIARDAFWDPGHGQLKLRGVSAFLCERVTWL